MMWILNEIERDSATQIMKNRNQILKILNPFKTPQSKGQKTIISSKTKTKAKQSDFPFHSDSLLRTTRISSQISLGLMTKNLQSRMLQLKNLRLVSPYIKIQTCWKTRRINFMWLSCFEENSVNERLNTDLILNL